MKICIVSSGYPIVNQPTVSGLYAANQTLACGLAAAGHDVHVVTFSGDGDWEAQGVSIHHVKRSNFHYFWGKIPLLGALTARTVRELELSFVLYRAVLRLNSRLKFDIVEGAEDTSVFISWANRTASTVIRLHGDDYTFLKYTPGVPIPAGYKLCRVVQRMGLRRASRLISPSAAHALQIAHEIHRDPAEISVVPHDLPARWPSGHDSEVENIVLFVSRLERRKGIIDALKGFSGLLASCPEAQLVVIGSSHATVPTAQITQLIDELNLKDNVKLLGSLPQEQIVAWYQKTRIFLFPTYYETFGLVALEAMACGLPIVAYRAGSIPEIVQDKTTGLLVEPGDIPGLTNCMHQLLSDDVRWHQMSEASTLASDQYRHSRTIIETEQVYKALLKNHHRQSEN